MLMRPAAGLQASGHRNSLQPVYWKQQRVLQQAPLRKQAALLRLAVLRERIALLRQTVLWKLAGLLLRVPLLSQAYSKRQVQKKRPVFLQKAPAAKQLSPLSQLQSYLSRQQKNHNPTATWHYAKRFDPDGVNEKSRKRSNVFSILKERGADA